MAVPAVGVMSAGLPVIRAAVLGTTGVKGDDVN